MPMLSAAIVTNRRLAIRIPRCGEVARKRTLKTPKQTNKRHMNPHAILWKYWRQLGITPEIIENRPTIAKSSRYGAKRFGEIHGAGDLGGKKRLWNQRLRSSDGGAVLRRTSAG